MGLLKAILKKAVPIPKLTECNSFVFIGPHPDDIEVGCGATVSKLAQMGKRLCFIIATDGQYGSMDRNTDKKELIRIRKEESISSARLLGVDDIRFLDFPDGGVYNIDELKNQIAIELAKFKPDIVFTVDNHMKAEIHPDHLNTGRATEMAFLYCSMPLMMKDLGVNEVASPKGLAYYYTDKPNSYINVTKTFNDKIQSIKIHKSQFLASKDKEKEFKMLCLYLKLMAIRYGAKRLCRYAESFRVLSSLHLHCAPDASNF